MRFATSIVAAAALLAACGGSQPPIGAPGAMPQASVLAARTSTSSYIVVHSFGAPPDGGCPTASLVNVHGTLYGTTTGGGAYDPYNCAEGLGLGTGGTVFRVTTGSIEKVLHSFSAAPSDGNTPQAALIDVNGTLYGTTYFGGTVQPSYGTVFSITTRGKEKVLHTFSKIPDGAYPRAPVIEVKGKLYGTTTTGGPKEHDGGTFFSLTAGGTETVLHTFTGRPGRGVAAGLIDVGGALYGVASRGGAHQSGVVFRITLSGREKVLHSFGSGYDGKFPRASLIDVNGMLYGTTEAGGTYRYGTVFSITPSGTEEVLHNFGNGTDGISPEASLIEVNGTLYGTTSRGGTYQCGRTGSKYFNCGTIFSITTSGTETVLHSFAGKPDGAQPYAGLVELGGVLYGTTQYGGTSGRGAVFALTP